MCSRLNGCYEALEGGNTAEALIDFTGGVSEHLSLDREALSQDSNQRKAFFQTLAQAHQRKALITCSIRVGLTINNKSAHKISFNVQPNTETCLCLPQPAEGETVESVLDCGLVRGHAYGMTAVKKVRLRENLMRKDGTCRRFMVRMRNPWGTTDWTGAWSQG